MVYKFGQMEGGMKDIGMMESKKGKENLLILLEMLSMDFGKMERILNGLAKKSLSMKHKLLQVK